MIVPDVGIATLDSVWPLLVAFDLLSTALVRSQRPAEEQVPETEWAR